jgi:hypothetical protein
MRSLLIRSLLIRSYNQADQNDDFTQTQNSRLHLAYKLLLDTSFIIFSLNLYHSRFIFTIPPWQLDTFFVAAATQRGSWHRGWLHSHLSRLPSPCLLRCLLQSLGNAPYPSLRLAASSYFLTLLFSYHRDVQFHNIEDLHTYLGSNGANIFFSNEIH